jgi:hypothetical protein
MFTLLLQILVVLAAAYVYHDASQRKIGHVPSSVSHPDLKLGFPNFSAGAWAILTLCLCFIFLPLYLYKREELTTRASFYPCESKYTKYIPHGVGALIVILLIMTAFGGSSGGSITFAEHVDENLNITNEGTEFTTGLVALIVRSGQPFGATEVVISSKKSGTERWEIVSQHVVSPEWDTMAAPIYLTDAGEYEVKATTDKGDVVGEGTVKIHESN